MISRTNCMRISSNGHAVARSALARPAAARVPAQRISLRPLRSTNSWEPTTELIAKADQAKVEELQRRFREADKDGCGQHPPILVATIPLPSHAPFPRLTPSPPVFRYLISCKNMRYNCCSQERLH